MSKQRKFILIAAAVGFISCFLPWVRVSFFGISESVNGMHGNGLLVFALFIVSGVLAFLGDQTTNLDKTKWTVTLIAGALIVLLVAYNIFDASGSAYGSFLSFGIYLAGLAGVGVVLGAFIYRSATDNLKDGFSSLKSNLETRMKNTSTTSTTPTTTTTNTTTTPTDTINTTNNINTPM